MATDESLKYPRHSHPMVLAISDDVAHSSFKQLAAFTYLESLWSEVTQALATIPGQHSADRPDIINHVFHVKLHLFMNDIVKKKFFWPCHYRLISAQLPDPSIDRVGYDAVAAFMMHGPCGDANPYCSCMVDSKCSKNYPKEYCDKTTILPNGHVRVGLKRKRACAGTNEIHDYLECRCIAPNEAAWRLLQFKIHYTDPAIERLHVHMPLENSVTFIEDDNLE
uniref:Helitron helicase-like domain-containing protein n=1 Tax=Oryza sativa subsp. japonica TaxID=39947 RepID=Q6Z373_ORYSJ|nr:hypothetical protein [Oryza sativa Japonica Group]BAD31244.1 hypothetical protein [Oryza sativa Japonica Group]